MKKMNVYVLVGKEGRPVEVYDSRRQAREAKWSFEESILKFELNLSKGKVVR